MKPKYVILITLVLLVGVTLACSTATPVVVTATPVPTETLMTLDLPIRTLDDFRLAVGTWSAQETDKYFVGILPCPTKVLYEGQDSFFLAMAIYRKDARSPIFPAFLIREHGGETIFTLDNGHTYHPQLITTTGYWPHYAGTDRIYMHLNRTPLCGSNLNDPGVPGMVGLGWIFQLNEGETGQVASITFKLTEPGVILFNTVP